jgi:hypothetical protein
VRRDDPPVNGRRRWTHDGGIHEIPLPPPASGRLWLCGKHAVGPDPDALMRRFDADTVVCLNEAPELQGRYPDYVDWLRAQPDERAIWFPIHDLHAPPFDAYLPLLDDLVRRLVGGATMIVHCGAGIGRAGTTAVAVLVELGVPLDDALATVRRHRPAAGPEVGPQLDLVHRLAQR